jgi:hypothetical protein
MPTQHFQLTSLIISPCFSLSTHTHTHTHTHTQVWTIWEISFIFKCLRGFRCSYTHGILHVSTCVYVCMHVRTYVCMYVCTYVCMYIMYVCMHEWMNNDWMIGMNERMHVCIMYVCVLCMYVCMYACVRACVRVCVCQRERENSSIFVFVHCHLK